MSWSLGCFLGSARPKSNQVNGCCRLRNGATLLWQLAFKALYKSAQLTKNLFGTLRVDAAAACRDPAICGNCHCQGGHMVITHCLVNKPPAYIDDALGLRGEKRQDAAHGFLLLS